MQVMNSGTQSRRGMVLPFQPLSLAFNHVNYYVDMPAVSKRKTILFEILYLMISTIY